MHALQRHPFPALPRGFQRGHVQELIVEIAPYIGMSANLAMTLVCIITHTRPRDWTEGEVEPICYAKQTTLAAKLGRTPRAVRAAEAKLAKVFRFIDKRVAANGGRSRAGGAGLTLSRLIEVFPALLTLRDQMRAERDRIEHLARRRSVLYRHAKESLIELTTRHGTVPALQSFSTSFLEWPASRDLRSLGLDALEAHLIAAKALCSSLDAYQNHGISSAQADDSFPPHIQDSKQDYLVDEGTCDEPKPLDEPQVAEVLDAAPDGAATCREKQREGAGRSRNPQSFAWLIPQQLYRLCSPDMQFYLDAEQQGHEPLSELHFKLAARRRLPELGINNRTWHDAVETVGEFAATLFLIVTDANRFHPKTPVANPSGYLRAMLQRHRIGTLNLAGSLIGLSERMRRA